MDSYVLDNLIKYHCFNCDKEFILSEYQIKDTDKEIICPYCHGTYIDDYVFVGEDDDLLYELGCLGIGHYEDQNEEAIAYEKTWGMVKDVRENLKQ